ncbi:MAG: peptidyl-alpha-hydroxyglycine alpha-amidating lyase family protein [Anaerolineae bacterium]|jgi:DNA-binding beta-propeller fold protein YncE
MSVRLGSGDYVYEELADWAQLPTGWNFQDAPDVVVDAQDRVYVFNRGAHPMVVFEPDGSFITSWGEGLFVRPHGVTLGPDGALYCVDDGAHCIYKCSLDGQVLATIGTPGQPAPRLSGKPFNQPTKVAFHPNDNLYIADGYGNARVHVYSPAGEHLFSWGSHGTDPGQFNLVHSIAIDDNGRVYIADRENHRMQVFDDQGNYLTQWNNLHRPCGLHIDGETVYIGQLLTHLSVNADYPNLGACVTIHDLSGRRLAWLGDTRPGEGPGQFTTPHGLAVDSRSDLYVGEVAWNAYGSRLDPPRMVRCFRKLVRISR